MQLALKRLPPFIEANARRGDPQSVVAAVDQFSERTSGLMHIGRHKGAILDQALERAGARRVLELGSFFGYSAVRMASHLPADGELVTIDIDREHHELTRWLVDFAGLGARVTPRLGRAADIIDELEGPFDVVFVDHYASNYLTDVKLVESAALLSPGALLVTDNVVMFESSLGGYLAHVRDSGRYRSELRRVGGDGVEVSAWQG